MEHHRFLDSSSEYCERLHDLLHGQELPSDERTSASAVCLHLALEHYRAVILLYREPLVISAGVLLRTQLEAYVKGAWLNRCATETQVRHFQKNKDLPTFGGMVSVLEKAIPGYGTELALIKEQAWRPLNSYVHSGAVQAEKRKTETEIVAPVESPM